MDRRVPNAAALRTKLSFCIALLSALCISCSDTEPIPTDPMPTPTNATPDERLAFLFGQEARDKLDADAFAVVAMTFNDAGDLHDPSLDIASVAAAELDVVEGGVDFLFDLSGSLASDSYRVFIANLGDAIAGDDGIERQLGLGLSRDGRAWSAPDLNAIGLGHVGISDAYTIDGPALAGDWVAATRRDPNDQFRELQSGAIALAIDGHARFVFAIPSEEAPENLFATLQTFGRLTDGEPVSPNQAATTQTATFVPRFSIPTPDPVTLAGGDCETTTPNTVCLGDDAFFAELRTGPTSDGVTTMQDGNLTAVFTADDFTARLSIYRACYVIGRYFAQFARDTEATGEWQAFVSDAPSFGGDPMLIAEDGLGSSPIIHAVADKRCEDY